jgi:hypothetical protein
MRTSTSIVEKIGRLLLLPGWQYVPWHFTPPFRSIRYTRPETRR